MPTDKVLQWLWRVSQLITGKTSMSRERDRLKVLRDGSGEGLNIPEGLRLEKHWAVESVTADWKTVRNRDKGRP